MVGHRTRQGESPGRVYLLHGGTISCSKFCDCFSAMSSGKVFFGPSAFRSLGVFFTDQAHYEKRSSTAKGLMLGVCFIAEGPVRRNTFRRSAQKITLKLPSRKLRRNDTPHLTLSSSSIISIALIFGAPLKVPAGRKDEVAKEEIGFLAIHIQRVISPDTV